MPDKYYLAMAYDVDTVGQSDYLFLLKDRSGKIVGYAPEFDMFTDDIAAACSPDNHRTAKWYGLTDDAVLSPARLSEIQARSLSHLLLGSKTDMRANTPLDPI